MIIDFDLEMFIMCYTKTKQLYNKTASFYFKLIDNIITKYKHDECTYIM